jgi:hypothetical protein
MRASITGTRNGDEWPARGQEIDLPDAEAVDLLNAGLAVPVREEKKQVEAAVKDERPTNRKRKN